VIYEELCVEKVRIFICWLQALPKCELWKKIHQTR